MSKSVLGAKYSCNNFRGVLNFTLLDEEYNVWEAHDVYCKIKIIGLLSYIV